MSELRLVIFDVDGTLVDSQGDIHAAMSAAFAAENLPLPDRAAVLSIVGLSLPMAMARLLPDAPEAQNARLVEAYKDSYASLRRSAPVSQTSPLYPGAAEVLAALQADPWTLLAIATGKSKRGLDKLIEGHGLEGVFVSQQVSDFHPSKPHPSMIETCLSDTGVPPERAVMVGDTTYDMDMARAAGIGAIGVSWGYHPAAELQADRLIDRFADLPLALDDVIGATK